MNISVISTGQGTFRVHAAGCADVKREAVKYRDGNVWTFVALTRHAANIDMWGDVASDEHAEGSEEWHAACDEFADSETRYLPCCAELA